MLDSKSPSHPKLKMANSPNTQSLKTSVKIKQPIDKQGLHARNLHKSGYDFALLILQVHNLAAYVKPNAFGNESIDFSNAKAVKALNQALLKTYYAIDYWDIPAHYLCPPIPGRADYIHNLADLIATRKHTTNAETVRVLDIGTGANIVYPLIGQRSYAWQFVGVDIDKKALHNAQQIIDNNKELVEAIELRFQSSPTHIFHGVIQANDYFDLTMCNPPFHSSLADAQAGTQRKWRNLGKTQHKEKLNFGGNQAELYCEGGEAAFIERMILESVSYQHQVAWFTTLVSKAENLPKIYKLLKQVKASEVTTLPMAQGQKQSRIVAWRFS